MNRSDHGFKAVVHGTPDFGRNGRDADGKRTDVADTLANIMHYCDRHAIDFDQALDSARVYHGAEAATAAHGPVVTIQAEPSRCLHGVATANCRTNQCAACPHRFPGDQGALLQNHGGSE